MTSRPDKNITDGGLTAFPPVKRKLRAVIGRLVIAGCRGLPGLALLLAGCGAASEQSALPPAAETTELFTDVTRMAGLSAFKHETGAFGEKWFPESMGSGCAFIDYDGDGLLDILLAGGGAWPESNLPEAPPALWLYRNQGNGHFVLQTTEAGLGDVAGYSIGFAVADYDNDGDQDFYLSTLTENMLFRNDGGVFTEIGQRAGVAGQPAWSTSVMFFDADLDGLLDLYVGNYVEWSPETDKFCSFDGKEKDYCTPQIYTGVPGRFYKNMGQDRFEDRTAQAGFSVSKGMTLGLLSFDFNRDGFVDLMLANDTTPDELYINNGDGTFRELGAQYGIAYDEKGRTRAGMGIDAGVVDSTGEVTVFVGNFSREMIGVYRYTGSDYFSDRAARSKIGRPSLGTLTFGLLLIDIDLDGDLDLFAANGHVQPQINKIADHISYAEPAHVFMNTGNGEFEDIAPRVGGTLLTELVARGAAYGDYDNDGDLDLLIAENDRGARLWRNETNHPHYLRINLEGTISNRDALGARVITYSDGRRMERFIRSGSSYLSASEQIATFGLGASAVVDSLIIRWPAGGSDRYTHLQGGQVLDFRETQSP